MILYIYVYINRHRYTMLSFLSISRATLLRNTCQVRSIFASAVTLKEAVKTKTSAETIKKAARKPTKKAEKTLTKTELKKSEKPKRPANAYALYLKEKFPTLKNDSNKSIDVTKQIAERWRVESDTIKESYKQKAAPAFVEYHQLIAKWEEKYKPTLNGYQKFLKVNLSGKATGKEDAAKLLKEYASQWKALSDLEKEAWKNREL